MCNEEDANVRSKKRIAKRKANAALLQMIAHAAEADDQESDSDPSDESGDSQTTGAESESDQDLPEDIFKTMFQNKRTRSLKNTRRDGYSLTVLRKRLIYDRGRWYEATSRTKLRVKLGSATSYCTRGPQEETSILRRQRSRIGGLEGKLHEDVIDTGAHKTVIGRKQAKAYCKGHGIKMQMTRSSRMFMFNDQVQKSLGKIV